MQAQDLNSALWSFGVRLPGLTAADVIASTERREALRTWPMRGTIHFVPARDAHWMLDLMGGKALAGAAARRAVLGLTEQVADRAVDVLGSALAGKRLTRAECVQVLADAGIDGAGQRAYHLLWYASQRGVTCFAPNIGNEQAFVLLDEWVSDPVRLGRDEALATMAVRYFRGHGPTTRQDFAGWTGLTAADTKAAIAHAGTQLATVMVDGVEMYAAARALDEALSATRQITSAGDEVLALPGFDEYLLGYKDRTMMVDDAHKEAIIPGGNGVFQPTIVRAGRVIGTWKRVSTKTTTTVTVAPLVKMATADRRQVEQALGAYTRFVGTALRVNWP